MSAAHPALLAGRAAEGAAAPVSRSLPHLPALDGLRGVAVLLVLLSHFPFVEGVALSKDLWSLAQALRVGYLGVDLFFVLSGFLITRGMLAERRATGRVSLWRFYVRRGLRIYPIYFLSVAFVALVYPTKRILLASLLVYGFNYYHPIDPQPYPMEHSWSLDVEDQFYLLWPLLFALIPLGAGARVTGLVIPTLAVLSAVALAATLEPTLAAAYIYTSLPTEMLSLSLGAYLAYREAEARPLHPAACLALAGGGALLLVVDLAGRGAGLIPPGGWYWCLALVGTSLACFGVVAHLALGRPMAAVKTVLCAPLLRWVGRLSYGLYLYHLLVLFLLGLNPAAMEGRGATGWQVALALVLSFGAAALSYALLEKRILRYKARFQPVVAAR
ncbi:MAG: acyltransferase [Alsobacter sp.]